MPQQIYPSQLFNYNVIGLSHEETNTISATAYIQVAEGIIQDLEILLSGDPQAKVAGYLQIRTKLLALDGHIRFSDKDDMIRYFFEDSNEIPIINYNLAIRGIGSIMNTKAIMASKLSVNESDISAFQVRGDDVLAQIDVNYLELFNAFNDPAYQNLLTGFIDTERSVNIAGQAYVACLIRYYESLNATSVGGRSFQSSGIRYIKLPNCTLISQRGFLNASSMRRLKMPSLNSIQDGNSFGNMINNTGWGKIQFYMPPAMLTDPIIVAASGQFDAIGIQNNTRPGDITDLSVSNVGQNSVQLNFTNPASVNGLSFFECWIDFGNGIYWMIDEIPNSGAILSNLPSSTQMKIAIKACDIYYNESLNYSNAVNFTTSDPI